MANSTSDWPRWRFRCGRVRASGAIGATFKQSGKHSVRANAEKDAFVRQKSKECVNAPGGVDPRLEVELVPRRCLPEVQQPTRRKPIKDWRDRGKLDDDQDLQSVSGC